MTASDDFLKSVEDYIIKFFATHPDDRLIYHNIAHTKRVVKRVAEISSHYPITQNEKLILVTSAWFHDIGHLINPAEGHEKSSISIMENYYRKAGLERKNITEIAACIWATKLPSKPETNLACILCDADLYHLGTKAFITNNKLVKKEIELRNNLQLQNWDEVSLAFLSAHRFHTGWCSAKLENGKLHNIEVLTQKIRASADK